MKSKILNRAFAVLLSLTLIIGLLPTIAFAANTATVQINGQVLQDGVPLQCGDGTAVLNAQDKTLTLTNATINQEVDGTSTPVFRAYNGNLKVILIGENTITSTTQRPFYASSVDLTIQGTKDDSLIIKTDADGLQVDNGNLTVDGCNIDITSTNWGGMMCWGGTLTIQQGANMIVDSYENTLIGDKGLFITDSTVNSVSHANYPTSAVFSSGNMSITNSTVTATSNGDETNAIYGVGNISINNSDVVATTISQKGYEPLCASGNIEIINHSTATVNSAGRIGIWSIAGSVSIEDSIAYVTANDNWDAIRGANGGATIKGSWVETFGSKVSPAFTSSDSVIFLNNEGTASGSLTLPGDVIVGKDMQLSIPEDSSITVPNGVSFTNHGQIQLLGDLINDGGTIVCDSHSGGTATCTSKAICDICGEEYGEINASNHTNLIKTEAKDATCTENGNTTYWTCESCGKIFSDENATTEIQLADTVIKAKGHSYENGKCTVCGATDPDYKDTNSPQTGDSSNILLLVSLLFVSGGVLGTMIIKRKNQSN